ncbi:hypothetical protein ELG88_08580 [Rhizobium leguminosarum]|uniref:hypothetical protein n=1 Tax=Rhizobium leguminosarum TaxID=384 RepID=UPI00103237C3|nr:hypothetical protein [Rhizobium leguminosarum]TBF35266.1 hypothetical protein ELG88_08580 [Rhizobium leguminosarum]
MKALFVVAALLLELPITGCGTYVPDLKEFYEKENTTRLKVGNFVSHVQCEIMYAVQSEMIDDIFAAENSVAKAKEMKLPHLAEGRRLGWLDTYAAQMTMNLTVEETGGINAGVSFNRPYSNAITNVDPVKDTFVSTSQVANLGLAAAYTTKATRKETLSLFIPFKSFTTPEAIAAERAARDRKQGLDCNQDGAFIEGDLKLKDWLDGALLPAYGDSRYAARLQAMGEITKKDAIQHEVTFVITSGASVTPSWKLVRISGNQGSTPFLNGQRVRTQGVIITLGKDTKGELPAIAQNVLLAAQIRNAMQGF